MKFIVRTLLISFILFTAMAQSHAMGQFFFLSNPMEGQKAPEFTLNSLNGTPVSLSAIKGNRPAIVFFWATWCPHCRQQLGALYNRTGALERQGIRVILVNLEEKPATVRGYLRKRRMDTDVLLDVNGRVAEEYGVIGIPTYFLIDAGGTIVSVQNAFPEDFPSLLRAGDTGSLPFGESGTEQAGMDK